MSETPEMVERVAAALYEVTSYVLTPPRRHSIVQFAKWSLQWVAVIFVGIAGGVILAGAFVVTGLFFWSWVIG